MKMRLLQVIGWIINIIACIFVFTGIVGLVTGVFFSSGYNASYAIGFGLIHLLLSAVTYGFGWAVRYVITGEKNSFLLTFLNNFMHSQKRPIHKEVAPATIDPTPSSGSRTGQQLLKRIRFWIYAAVAFLVIGTVLPLVQGNGAVAAEGLIGGVGALAFVLIVSGVVWLVNSLFARNSQGVQTE